MHSPHQGRAGHPCNLRPQPALHACAAQAETQWPFPLTGRPKARETGKATLGARPQSTIPSCASTRPASPCTAGTKVNLTPASLQAATGVHVGQRPVAQTDAFPSPLLIPPRTGMGQGPERTTARYPLTDGRHASGTGRGAKGPQPPRTVRIPSRPELNRHLKAQRTYALGLFPSRLRSTGAVRGGQWRAWTPCAKDCPKPPFSRTSMHRGQNHSPSLRPRAGRPQ